LSSGSVGVGVGVDVGVGVVVVVVAAEELWSGRRVTLSVVLVFTATDCFGSSRHAQDI
jgi:hypothetical protein